MKRAFGAAMALAAAISAGEAAAAERHVTVTGRGEVSAAPDMAHLRISVAESAVSASEAASLAAQKAVAMIGALKKEGVAEADLQTASIDLAPIYSREDGRRTQKLDGYEVRHSFSVVIRDLMTLGAVLDAAANVGAESIGGVRFDIAARDAMEKEALALAVSDARAQAEALAGAAAATVGDALAITTGARFQPRPEMARMAMDAPTPIATGALTVAQSATVTFALE